MDEKPEKSAFEAFVQKIAAVPKEVVERIEAERIKRVKRPRKSQQPKP